MDNSKKNTKRRRPSTGTRSPSPNGTDHPNRKSSTQEQHESADADHETAFVSEVIGTGKDAHRLVRVNNATLTVWSEYGDAEPRMLDTDVAKRIGFERPRDIRKLIERIWPENQRPHVRATVARTQMPTGGTRKKVVDTYWLTEAQILKVCARSETPVADAILDEMIAVYIAARRGLLLPVASARETARLKALEDAFAARDARLAALEQELANGTIGEEVARTKIQEPLQRIASLYAADKKTIASKRRSLQKKLRNLLGHNRRGCVWSRLDRKLLTPAEHQIGEWFDDAVRHARANPPGQLPLRLVPAATLTK